MVSSRRSQVFWSMGALFAGLACGDTPGVGGPPGGEGLGPEEMGTMRLAITLTSCNNLMGVGTTPGWPFSDLHIVARRYNPGASAGVEATGTNAKITKNRVGLHCAAGHDAATTEVVLYKLDLRPGRYRIGLEVIAEVDGTKFQLNNVNEVNVDVTAGSTTTPTIEVTQAALRAVDVGATFTAWTP